VKDTISKYPQQVTIQHWQLRDLVQAPRSRYEFFTVNHNNVEQFCIQDNKVDSVFKNLDFTPTSITMGFGFAAAGGQRGQLIVRELDGLYYVNTHVGRAINNALTISQHMGELRLLVCNNDETIKIYELPSLASIATLQLPTACNHAAISPDGKKLVAVGDSNEVFLYDIRGQTYTLIQSFQATSEANFSCAWNRSDDLFAVASQDGYVSVFDVRQTTKLAQLPAKQRTQVRGVCRCVKFAPTGPIDLLMFSEHVSYVHLVDTRLLDNQQTIKVPSDEGEQHIAGITFTPESKSILIGTEHSVYEYEIDTKGRRLFYHGDVR
jgi:WD40 repeat protein